MMGKMKFFKAALTLVAVMALTACGNKGKTNEAESGDTQGKSLVLYYSQTGATKAVAKELQKQLGCDIAEIVPVNPYDGDYDATVRRWRFEVDSNLVVPIHPVDVDLSNYETIYLGFPIWGGTFASPIKTFLEENSLKGKKIVTFATFGSGGIDSATDDVRKMQPDADVIKGYGVRNARIDKSPAEIDRFLIENGLKEGVLEELAAYEEPTVCNEAAVEIFNRATSGYKFPLGEPVSVSKRETPSGTDYRYEAKSVSPDGKEQKMTIYVVMGPDSIPEFTEVVRK